jgi:glycosyltransferase involved in cell wall biosynthesis
VNSISVIVPIFNSEKYLRRCIDSILNQTYEKLEIILVNDGSTDLSGYIIEEYSRQDSRIIVINKSNGGPSSARNRGIEAASKEYIAFVDSDDWIAKDIYEYCIELAETNNADVVDFGIVYTLGESSNTKQKKRYDEISIEGKEILRNYLIRGQTDKTPFSTCRKLYKRKLFEHTRFPEGRINEDIATNYKILMKAKKLVITDKVGYYYFQNSLSTTRNGLKNQDFDLLYASTEIVELTKSEDYPDIKYLARIKHARSFFSLLVKIAFYGVTDIEIDRKSVIKELTYNLRKNYFLLIKSPMPINRKIMTTALSIDFRCLLVPLTIYKIIKKGIGKK